MVGTKLGREVKGGREGGREETAGEAGPSGDPVGVLEPTSWKAGHWEQSEMCGQVLSQATTSVMAKASLWWWEWRAR